MYVYPLYSRHPFTTVRDTTVAASFRPVMGGVNAVPATEVISARGDPDALSGRLTETIWVIDVLLAADGNSAVAPALVQLGYRRIDRQVATGALLERWMRTRDP